MTRVNYFNVIISISVVVFTIIMSKFFELYTGLAILLTAALITSVTMLLCKKLFMEDIPDVLKITSVICLLFVCNNLIRII